MVDEEFADHMCDSLAGKTVAELLPDDGPKLIVVEPDDNVIEIAAHDGRQPQPAGRGRRRARAMRPR